MKSPQEAGQILPDRPQFNQVPESCRTLVYNGNYLELKETGLLAPQRVVEVPTGQVQHFIEELMQDGLDGHIDAMYDDGNFFTFFNPSGLRFEYHYDFKPGIVYVQIIQLESGDRKDRNFINGRALQMYQALNE